LKTTGYYTIKISNLILLIFLFSTNFYSQEVTQWKIESVDSLKINKIENYNNSNLILFIDKLKRLKNRTLNKNVHIIHIGDSHIQGDVFTNTIKNSLENHFGKGGVGLFFPYKLANTNGNSNQIITSKNNWISKRITSNLGQLNSGLMGYVIQTKDSSVQLNILSKNDLYGFNKIKIFAKNSANQMQFSADSINSKVYQLNNDFADIRLEKLIDRFNIGFKTAKDSITNIYGVSIENDSIKGLVYNSIGVNGAKYSDYNSSPSFWKQLQYIDADCIILSLGTNEAQNKNIDFFSDELLKTVSKIKQTYPSAAIIVTTPPISYYKKISINSNISSLGEIIKKTCLENDICYWDLYCIQKEIDNKVHWKKNNLLRSDLVHYSVKGYQLQAKLFINAFQKLWFNFTEPN
jgi:hypothetical protein